MTGPGPVGGYRVQDVCDCRCHRIGNPEDYDCCCRGCGEGLEDDDE